VPPPPSLVVRPKTKLTYANVVKGKQQQAATPTSAPAPVPVPASATPVFTARPSVPSNAAGLSEIKPWPAGFRYAHLPRALGSLAPDKLRWVAASDYVTRAMQACTNEMQQDIVRGAVRQLAKDAIDRGDFDARDWSHEPLPLYAVVRVPPAPPPLHR
jgi:hypothetical protein